HRLWRVWLCGLGRTSRERRGADEGTVAAPHERVEVDLAPRAGAVIAVIDGVEGDAVGRQDDRVVPGSRDPAPAAEDRVLPPLAPRPARAGSFCQADPVRRVAVVPAAVELEV